MSWNSAPQEPREPTEAFLRTWFTNYVRVHQIDFFMESDEQFMEDVQPLFDATEALQPASRTCIWQALQTPELLFPATPLVTGKAKDRLQAYEAFVTDLIREDEKA